MKVQRLLGGVLVGGVGLLWLTAAIAEDAPGREGAIVAGKVLFQKHWEAGKPSAPGGDGLGPMFNAASCDACHNQGSVGGGGSIDFNVDLLSHVESRPHCNVREPLKSLHPSFAVNSNQDVPSHITLHRFSSSPKYAILRQTYAGTPLPLVLQPQEREELQRRFAVKPVHKALTSGEITLMQTQRQTPALFGAGLIDAIPDELLQKLAAIQPFKYSGITGRVPQVRIDKVGRFGWRGQTEHLSDFVLGACANELGLQVPNVAQPMDHTQPDYRSLGLDLTQEQCDSITAFVASLPAPKFVTPEDEDKARVAEFGRTIFHSVGCAACHVETVGPATEVYSDLLLHDMGPALGDPVAAEHEFKEIERRNVSLGHGKSKVSQSQPEVPQRRGYSGGSGPPPVQLVHINQPISESTAIRVTFQHVPNTVTQEWRTPPLWGVASSGPYLHDGRAATLLEAIALHGGEAKTTTARFLELRTTERMALLEFLNCLKAPADSATQLAGK
jgi:CxxC motif-containing protein (DUF1111 family)